MRRVYRESAAEHGVEWKRRDYRPDDFSAGDPINQALSAATTCLYGITHAVIVALGCSPGLGFIHTGHVRSFVFDIADLYKAEVAIPVAFAVAGREPDDVAGETRRAVRDAVFDGKILTRCARDIRGLLLPDEPEDEVDDWGVVELWDGANRRVAGGTSYGDEVDVPW